MNFQSSIFLNISFQFEISTRNSTNVRVKGLICSLHSDMCTEKIIMLQKIFNFFNLFSFVLAIYHG